MKISAYVVTLNEEERLPKTLEQLKKVSDEIIVVDSGSTDKTVEIAESFGANVIHNEWVTYCEQKFFAEQQCKNDWVLLIDADEVLSDKLVKEINSLTGNEDFAGYKITIEIGRAHV